MYVGVRPSEAYIADEPLKPGDIPLRGGRVHLIEFLGFANYAMISLGSVEMRTSIRKPGVKEGDEVIVYVDRDKLKLFNKHGEAIL